MHHFVCSEPNIPHYLDAIEATSALRWIDLAASASPALFLNSDVNPNVGFYSMRLMAGDLCDVRVGVKALRHIDAFSELLATYM